MEKKRTYYFVLIVAMATLMMFVGTMSSAGFGLMLNGIKKTIGLTGTQTSSLLMVKNLAAFILVFFADRYYNKLGLRLGVTLAFIYGIIATVLFSISGGNLAIMYGAAVILGATYAFTMILPMSLLLRRWFNKYRPLTTSIASAGTGLSTFVLSPIIQRIINNQGLSYAFLFQASLYAIVGVIFFLLVRNDPSDVGLEIYGGEDYVEEKKATRKAADSGKAAPILKTSQFAVLVFILCALGIGFYAAPSQQHFVLHLNSIGYDSMLVASAYSMMGLGGLIAKPLYGVLSMRIPFGWLSAIFLSLRVIALVAAFFVGGPEMGTWLPFFICILYAFGSPITTSGFTNWVADFSTKADYPKKVKNAQFAYQGSEIVGALIPGIIFDMTGRYSGWFGIAAIVATIVMIVVAVMYMNRAKIVSRDMIEQPTTA